MIENVSHYVVACKLWQSLTGQMLCHEATALMTALTLFAGLPTVHHYATRTPSPSWKFVQDLPHKKSRLAQKATEAK